jgi:tetratricopeptide (TPR) repeat protein
MRQERTVQATIFEVFAGHEISCELKAISQWLDWQSTLASLAAGDLRRHGVRETGGRGLPAEAVLHVRCSSNSGSCVTKYTKGNLLMLQGEHALAIDAYRIAINLNPSFSHAYSRIGLAKLELGEPVAAFEPVLKALRLSPREFQTSLCDLYLGIAAFHLERDDEATEWLLKAIATDSRYGLPHAWLAAIYALAHSVSDARAELAEFNRLTPGHTVATLRARAIKESRVPGAA